MAGEKDLYAVLGLERGASQDDIKRAYRKLARKHHPDVNPGNAKAEEAFKNIAAAYEVLSNEERRKLYDEFGEEGLRTGFDPDQARSYRRWAEERAATGADVRDGDVDFDFGDLFGARAGRAGHAGFRAAGQDFRAEVQLDFVTALRGTQLSLRLPVDATCSACSGSGEQAGSKARPCVDCSGTGKRRLTRGPMNLVAVCQACGGDGVVREPCQTCAGAGVVKSEQVVDVRIPPGAEDGSELRVRGRGGPGLGGAPDGDLLIRTRVSSHPHFSRDGLDLLLKLPITLNEAYNGASISVPTLTGSVQMKVPPRSQTGSKLRLRGKGVARGNEVGDLYVELAVHVPDVESAALASAVRDSDALYKRPLREEIRL